MHGSRFRHRMRPERPRVGALTHEVSYTDPYEQAKSQYQVRGFKSPGPGATIPVGSRHDPELLPTWAPRAPFNALTGVAWPRVCGLGYGYGDPRSLMLARPRPSCCRARTKLTGPHHQHLPSLNRGKARDFTPGVALTTYNRLLRARPPGQPDLDGTPARDVLRSGIRRAPFGPGLILPALRRPRALVRAPRVDFALGVFGGLCFCLGFLFHGLERCGARALVLGQVTLLVLLARTTRAVVVSPRGPQTYFAIAVTHGTSRWFELNCVARSSSSAPHLRRYPWPTGYGQCHANVI
jgi:hypothetical protein